MLWQVLPPPPFTDSIHVFRAARLWPDIPVDAAPLHQMCRVGLLLPSWAAQQILGYGQAAYYATSLFLMSFFAVGCYLSGRVLFGDGVGLFTVVLLLVHPFFTIVDPYVESVNASTGGILPDAPAAGLFAIGFAAVVVAARRDGRAQAGLLLASGVVLGAAFLCREFVAFMYAAVPVFFLLLGIPLRRILLVAAPVAGVAALGMLHNELVFGDAFVTLHAAESVADGGASIPWYVALGRLFEAMLTSHWQGAVLLTGLALTIVGWALTRDRGLALCLVWFLSLWIPLTLLGGVLNGKDPDFEWGYLPRYWTPIFPPLIVGGLGTAVILSRRIRAGLPRTITTTAVASALLLVYLVLTVQQIQPVERDAAWNELRGWLAKHQNLTLIWTDSYSAQTLQFYTRSPFGRPLWHGRVETFLHERALLPGKVTGPLLHTRYGAKTPPSLESGWRSIWKSSDGATLSVWIREPKTDPRCADCGPPHLARP
ncbi:hypothetical protein GCM10010191_01620 [Actinomadura vinacea]|uniref:Glycosyltransferase RgtA/B/C/D-like domain-containing protein n=2 Tax=Actinomadura vinacea TaxID=115336 RepID=A0ABN3IAS0_9ACTN